MRMESFKNFIYEGIEWKPLSHTRLVEKGIGDIFLNKIKNGEAHAVKGGQFIINKDLLPIFQKLMLDKNLPRLGGKKAVQVSGKLEGRRKTILYPHDFFKTVEYGGRGEESGTRAETGALQRFQDKFFKILERTGRSALKIQIAGKNRRVIEMADIIQPPGTPKADFIILDRNQNEVAYISHKMGDEDKFGQQYGGISDRGTGGIFTSGSVRRELESFLGMMAIEHGEVQDEDPRDFDGLISGESYARAVKNDKAIGQTIYGIDYPSRKAGLENVDEYHVGDLYLTSRGRGVYEIMSLHKKGNGDIPKRGSKFEAFWSARATPSIKTQYILGKAYVGTRFGIYPRAALPPTVEII